MLPRESCAAKLLERNFPPCYGDMIAIWSYFWGLGKSSFQTLNPAETRTGQNSCCLQFCVMVDFLKFHYENAGSRQKASTGGTVFEEGLFFFSFQAA